MPAIVNRLRFTHKRERNIDGTMDEGNVVDGFRREMEGLLRVSHSKLTGQLLILLLITTTEHDYMTLIWTGKCAFGRFDDYLNVSTQV